MGIYVRSMRIQCNLKCFLLLKRRSRSYRAHLNICVFYSVFCVKKAECTGMYWYSQYFVDARYEPFF